MKRATKIGVGQIVLVFIVCRVIVALTHTFQANGAGFTMPDLMGVVFSLPFTVLFSLPVFWLLKRNPERNIIECAYDVAKPVGVTVSVLFSLFFLYLCIVTSARFDLFVTTNITPEQPPYGFIILILPPVIYAAVKGIEAITRTGAIVSVLSIAAIVVITLALAPRMNGLYLTSPFETGWGRVIQSTISNTAETMEILALAVLAPKVSGHLFRGYCGFCLSSLALVFVIIATVVAVLGGFGNSQMFPYYTVSSIAQIGVFKHLDAIQSSVWLVCVFIKCAFYLYLSYFSIRRLIPKKAMPWCIVVFGAIVMIAASLATPGIDNMDIIFSPYALGLGLLALGVLLPFALIAAGAVKGAKSRKEEGAQK